jgi:hypothetical protein
MVEGARCRSCQLELGPLETSPKLWKLQARELSLYNVSETRCILRLAGHVRRTLMPQRECKGNCSATLGRGYSTGDRQKRGEMQQKADAPSLALCPTKLLPRVKRAKAEGFEIQNAPANRVPGLCAFVTGNTPVLGSSIRAPVSYSQLRVARGGLGTLCAGSGHHRSSLPNVGFFAWKTSTYLKPLT